MFFDCKDNFVSIIGHKLSSLISVSFTRIVELAHQVRTVFEQIAFLSFSVASLHILKIGDLGVGRGGGGGGLLG